MGELQTYKQAQEFIEQQLKKRELDLTADGLLPNPHGQTLLQQTKQFLRKAREQEEQTIDKQGEQLLKQLLGTLQEYDSHTTRNNKTSIEDLF